MPFDPHTAASRLRVDAGQPFEAPEAGWPGGAPVRELIRSPAAARVGREAARNGLFLFHFEHRGHLALPEDWLPAERPGLAEPPAWESGVLPERKYQSFRHDLALGSFHPGHRAKWTTHELCHGLVGFAWRPDATRFFHATAGRLAELLPVVLWYFLDEVHLRRCPVHAGGGALFRAFCPDCERVAAPRPDDARAVERLQGARRFLDRELAAVARSRREGRPIAHQWATLDLCSDGVAYADAHGERLDSETFRRFAADFLVEGGGMVATLDALEHRVVQVARWLVGGDRPEPLAPTPAHGRWRWILQDVGWRLLQVHHQTGGEAARVLSEAVDDLAAVVPSTVDPEHTPEQVEGAAVGALQRLMATYWELEQAYVLPHRARFLATGYVIPQWAGTDLRSLDEGIRSATPLLAEALGERMHSGVLRFAVDDLVDRPERVPLGRRWARWLAADSPDDPGGLAWGPLAELARYEAALAHPPRGDQGTAHALGWGGAGDELRLAPGLALHRFDTDVLGVAEALAAGADLQAALLAAEDTPRALAIGRDPEGAVAVYDLRPEAADALGDLGDGGRLDLPDDEIEALRSAGVVVPVGWAETAPPPS